MLKHMKNSENSTAQTGIDAAKNALAATTAPATAPATATAKKPTATAKKSAAPSAAAKSRAIKSQLFASIAEQIDKTRGWSWATNDLDLLKIELTTTDAGRSIAFSAGKTTVGDYSKRTAVLAKYAASFGDIEPSETASGRVRYRIPVDLLPKNIKTILDKMA